MTNIGTVAVVINFTLTWGLPVFSFVGNWNRLIPVPWNDVDDEEPQEFPVFVSRNKLPALSWHQKCECRLEILGSVIVSVCVWLASYPGPYTRAVRASLGLVSTVLRMRQIFTEICEIVNYSVILRILLHPLRHYYWVELTVVSWILYCKCGCPWWLLPGSFLWKHL